MVVHVIEAGEGIAMGKKFLKREIWFMAGWGVAGRVPFNPQVDKEAVFVNPGPGSVQICSLLYVEEGKPPIPVNTDLPLPLRLEPGQSAGIKFA